MIIIISSNDTGTVDSYSSLLQNQITIVNIGYNYMFPFTYTRDQYQNFLAYSRRSKTLLFGTSRIRIFTKIDTNFYMLLALLGHIGFLTI